MHLDGSLRPETMLELARERDVRMPRDAPEALSAYMTVADGASLEGYLKRFDVTLSVMQDAEALDRIAYELAEDHASEGVWHVEVRFCPLLNTAGGLDCGTVIDAVVGGLNRAERDFDLHAAVIVCGLRSMESHRSVEMAELAVAYRDRGVCGFDLAGAEAGHPVRDHAAAFDLAERAGLPITIHAGEGFGPTSIRQALEVGHARRIGHGTRLHEDAELLDHACRRGILLETCLTSNVQTGAVDALSSHPAARYLRAGIPISLSTDNRLMSGVSLTDEYENAQRALGLTWKEVVTVARSGFEHAFVDDATRSALLADFDRKAEDLDRDLEL